MAKPLSRLPSSYPGDLVGATLLGPIEPTVLHGAIPGMMWVDTTRQRLFRAIGPPLKWFPADVFWPVMPSLSIFPLAGSDMVGPGLKGSMMVASTGRLAGVEVLSTAPGNLTLDIRKTTMATYPPTVANSVCNGHFPQLAGAQKFDDDVLAGWTTPVALEDILSVYVLSGGQVGIVTVHLQIQQS